MGTERVVPHSPPEAVLKMRAAAKLTRQGVGVLGADRLLKACAEDSKLVLLTLPLPRFSGLREGDRVRVTIEKQLRAVVVELLETGIGSVALCCRPVDVSKRDDVASSLPVRKIS